jgi:hypothetical protein
MPSRLTANKIDKGLLLKGQVPSLIVEELFFNKSHQNFMPIKFTWKL